MKVVLTDINGNSVKDIKGNVVESVKTSSTGKYKFDNLVASKEYVVKFVSDNVKLDEYILTSKNNGSDNSIDSDAEGIYESEKLVSASIKITDLPSVSEQTVPIYESKNNDAGFYEVEEETTTEETTTEETTTEETTSEIVNETSMEERSTTETTSVQTSESITTTGQTSSTVQTGDKGVTLFTLIGILLSGCVVFILARKRNYIK